MHHKNHIKVRNKKNKGRNIEFIDTASYFYLARLVHCVKLQWFLKKNMNLLSKAILIKYSRK